MLHKSILLFIVARTLAVPVQHNGIGKQATLDKSATDAIINANEATDAVPSLFEGDIQLDAEDLALLNRHKNNYKRNAQRLRQGLWRTRVVPYEIDSLLVNEGFVEAINAAIEELHKHTCVRWVRRTAEQNWVKFVKANKCASRVGKKYWSEGFQEIHLSSKCRHRGTILHEMMHASGFWHEQSRPDRNQYVEIMWENIEKGREDNFQKYSHPSIDSFGTRYDYKSIMHYGRLAFSSNSEPTIKALGNPDMELGQRDGLSDVDIIKLNALYDCKSPTGGWSSWSTFTPCGDDCQKFRQRYCTAVDMAACPGADYYGIHTQTVRCSYQECNVPVDGHWGMWSSWSTCSASCDKGTHTRTRLCDDPAPKRGGKKCVGSAVDRKECAMKSCHLGRDDCQFDADGWCHWTQDKTDTNPIDWQRKSGPTLTFGTGPSGDHTSGSGFYVYAEASAPATIGNTARLQSRAFEPTSARCMTFWYSMYGPGIGALRVYIQNTATSYMEKIWQKQRNQGNKWINGTVDIHSSTEFKIVFEAVRGPSFQGDIALDDVIFSEGHCGRSQSTTTKPLTELGTTLATNTSPGITSAETTSSLPTSAETTSSLPTSAETTSSPTSAETTSSPTSAETTSSLPTSAETTSSLPTSAETTSSLPTSAETTSSLPTSAETTSSPTSAETTSSLPTSAETTSSLPTSAETTSSLPTSAETTLSLSTSAETTSSLSTSAKTTSLKTSPPDTTPSSETTQQFTTTATAVFFDDFCDFGESRPTLCTWINDPSNSVTPFRYVFDWWWMKLPTPSKNTGPSADHTNGDGYYIYLESSSPYQPGNKARLLSKQYQASTDVCLDFWYHMFGRTIGSLTVYLDNDTGRHRVWELKGNQGNEWREARVSLHSNSSFKLIFEGERGMGYQGDIGLDDVTVKSGLCIIAG